MTATVVRVQHPASVEPGSAALVLADGTIEGFVGGVVPSRRVKAYSLLALKSRGAGALADPPRPGRRARGGVRPARRPDGRRGHGQQPVPVRRGDRGLPRAVAAGPGCFVGNTPTVGAAGGSAAELGFEATPPATRAAEGDLALVVAHRDDGDAAGALRPSCLAPPRTRRRLRGLARRCRARSAGGPPRAAAPGRGAAPGSDRRPGRPRDRLHTPAEIALSILAEVVAVRRQRPAAGDDARSTRSAG